MINAMVSIIVPIYNVEVYLEKCLDSIRFQTYKNIEVLMVDDGSSDRSCDIAKKYEKEDTRFIYLKKINGGLSSARNLGLEKAKGDFVSFIDSDDFISADFVSRLLRSFEEEIDVVIADYAIYDKQKKKFYYHKGMAPKEADYKTTAEKELVLSDLLNQGSIYMSTCKNMYRVSFLKKNDIMFVSERLVYAEDQLFNLEVYSKANSIRTTPSIIYFHLVVEGSLSQGYRKNMFEMNKDRFQRICTYLSENFSGYLLQLYNDRFPEIVIDSMVMLCRCKLSQATSNLKKILRDEDTKKALYCKNVCFSKKSYQIIYFFTKINKPWCIALLIKMMLRVKRYLRKYESKKEYMH